MNTNKKTEISNKCNRKQILEKNKERKQNKKRDMLAKPADKAGKQKNCGRTASIIWRYLSNVG